ncbi:UPF0047 protein TM0723 [hydrothermal vent metagenome]|uniref:UPF0047 protein TM0723 n=1 Tax=hydrothermal vent metagenome TaxID=652676 RepID=A0A3B1BW79_9ZZZZ
MTFHTEYLCFNTSKRREYINITSQVEDIVSASGIKVWAVQQVYYAEFDGKRKNGLL